MKTPRFTDHHRFPRPYADAKASSEPGYLAGRFEKIREQQAQKVKPIIRAKVAA